MAAYPGKLRGDYASLKRAGIPGGDGYRGPNTTFLVQGSRTVAWRCGCGTVNQAPYTPLAETDAHCRSCRRITTQERILS